MPPRIRVCGNSLKAGDGDGSEEIIVGLHIVGFDFQGVGFSVAGDNGFGWLTQTRAKRAWSHRARTYLAPKVRLPTALAMAPATSDCPYCRPI